MIIASVLIGRFVYWLFVRWLKRWAEGTETQLDDILTEQLREPIVFLIVLFGIRFALNLLTLPERIMAWPDAGFLFWMAIMVGWFIVSLYNALHQEYFMPLAARTKTLFDDHFFPILAVGVKFLVWVLALIVGLIYANVDLNAIFASLLISIPIFMLTAHKTTASVWHHIRGFGQIIRIHSSAKNTGRKWLSRLIILGFLGSSIWVVLLLDEFYRVQTEDQSLIYETANENAVALTQAVEAEDVRDHDYHLLPDGQCE